MQKYDLLRSGDNIIRVLDIKDGNALVLDCVKKTMPVWVEVTALTDYSPYSMESTTDIDTLSAEQRKVMHDRYTMIAPILPFIADVKMRSQVLRSQSEEHGVSKQTIRNYLCQYLAYMDIAALAPKAKSVDQSLTPDEKNMRWALNKFFYNRKKNSLKTAYTLMLKEKYCNNSGVLSVNYPSFHQFRYFYRKTKKLQNYYISRNGLTNYQRNNRP